LRLTFDTWHLAILHFQPPLAFLLFSLSQDLFLFLDLLVFQNLVVDVDFSGAVMVLGAEDVDYGWMTGAVRWAGSSLPGGPKRKRGESQSIGPMWLDMMAASPVPFMPILAPDFDKSKRRRRSRSPANYRVVRSIFGPKIGLGWLSGRPWRSGAFSGAEFEPSDRADGSH
jgi:hypothetical protein